jgi:hypothetical protein
MFVDPCAVSYSLAEVSGLLLAIERFVGDR